MKGEPFAPQCGFSSNVAKILGMEGVLKAKEFAFVNVLADDSLRSGVKKFSNWPTIPQLYIRGEFIGGSDIVKTMYESGELKTRLKKCNLEE